jgi:hypothetical protein
MLLLGRPINDLTNLMTLQMDVCPDYPAEEEPLLL